MVTFIPSSAPAGKLGLSSCLSSGGGVRDASRAGAPGAPRPGAGPPEAGPAPPSPWKFWLVTRKISIASVSLDSRALCAGDKSELACAILLIS